MSKYALTHPPFYFADVLRQYYSRGNSLSCCLLVGNCKGDKYKPVCSILDLCVRYNSILLTGSTYIINKTESSQPKSLNNTTLFFKHTWYLKFQRMEEKIPYMVLEIPTHGNFSTKIVRKKGQNINLGRFYKLV